MKLGLRDRRVLVIGLGISGRSAARFCAAQGAHVVAVDEGSDPAFAELEHDTGIDLRIGAPLPDVSAFDLVVPSPGVPRERYADARSVAGDIELAGRALAVPFAAVTGTNGKSTTVSMAEAMLRASGLRVRAAGNLGIPALSLVGQALDCAVLEVSSFQLEATEHFRPAVAAVLNLSPDHLDRHGDFEHYAATKRRILANQAGDDVAVLGVDDPAVAAFDSAVNARRFPFSMRRALDEGVWSDGTALMVSRAGATERLTLDGFAPAGAHDVENAAAALAIAVSLGGEARRCVSALADYRGLPHRCEVVAERAGVRFVDDSKATNPGAAISAVAGQGRPVVWIAGGRGKGLSFDALADCAAAHAHAVLLIGESSPALARALAGRTRIEECGTLDRAVARAAAIAKPGETVLLAPACASFDQYPNYAARGEHFQRLVRALETVGAA